MRIKQSKECLSKTGEKDGLLWRQQSCAIFIFPNLTPLQRKITELRATGAQAGAQIGLGLGDPTGLNDPMHYITFLCPLSAVLTQMYRCFPPLLIQRYKRETKD